MKTLLTAFLIFMTSNLYAATVNFTGWETKDTSEALVSSGTLSVQQTTKRTGTSALQTNPTTTAVGFHRFGTYDAAATHGSASIANNFARFYFRYATKPSADTEPIMEGVSVTTTTICELRINSTGNLVLYDSALGTVFTGATTLAADTWYRIEVKFTIGVPGDYEVLIDGVSESSGTYTSGVVNCTRIGLGKVNNRNGRTVDFFYDDFLWSDSALPGAGSCQVMQTSANGNYQTWTGTGDHWDDIVDMPTGPSALSSTNVDGDAETEGLESASSAGVTGTVTSVKPFASFQANDTTYTLRLRFRSASTDSDSSSFTGGTLIRYAKIYDTDPATSSAWVLSALDSIEAGAVEKSTTQIANMFSAGAMVDYIPAAASSRRKTVFL